MNIDKLYKTLYVVEQVQMIKNIKLKQALKVNPLKKN
jgi:hypothetical protein